MLCKQEKKHKVKHIFYVQNWADKVWKILDLTAKE